MSKKRNKRKNDSRVNVTENLNKNQSNLVVQSESPTVNLMDESKSSYQSGISMGSGKLKWYTLNGKCRFLSLLLFVCLSFSMSAETIKGVPVHIASGDSFLMMIDWGKYINIKLHGIDAPEENEPFFKDSREMLADYINGKKLEVYVKTQENGTVTGEVIVKDRGNVNLYMLREGMAKKTDEKRPSYRHAESVAKKKFKGVWSE